MNIQRIRQDFPDLTTLAELYKVNLSGGATWHSVGAAATEADLWETSYREVLKNVGAMCLHCCHHMQGQTYHKLLHI